MRSSPFQFQREKCGLAVFNSYRDDIKGLRAEVQELTLKVSTVKGDAEEERVQLESWWKRKYGELCNALGDRDHYDQNLGACLLEDGQVLLKNDPPYLPKVGH